MASVVMYDSEFDGHLDNGLAPERYRYRFLAEGDSWMDRSSMFHTSLLQELAEELDARGTDAMIVNLAMFGDTMHRIGDCQGDVFRMWLETQFAWKFDAVLFSAAGNDFIDAARDPDPGQGILRDLRQLPPPANGRDCIDANAVQLLKSAYLDPNFATLRALAQGSRHADLPILLNSYDLPTARDAPAFPGGRSWLSVAYRKNGIPAGAWTDLTDGIFESIEAVIDGWANAFPNVQRVPTRGTLVRAAPGSTGDSNDWLNEIHPNRSGWRKLARVWADAIAVVVP